MSASVCTFDEVAMTCLLAEIEWDMMVLVHDMQMQVEVAQIQRRKKRIGDLEAHLREASLCANIAEFRGNKQAVEYWEHRKFIAEQDIFWSGQELKPWVEHLNDLRCV
jgi:hypothetical protein